MAETEDKSMTCLEAQKLTMPYLRRELTDSELEAFVNHVDTCKDCLDELNISFVVYEELSGEEKQQNESYDFEERLHEDLESARRYLHVQKMEVILRKVMNSAAHLALLAVIVLFGGVATPPTHTMPCHAATDQDAPRQTRLRASSAAPATSIIPASHDTYRAFS